MAIHLLKEKSIESSTPLQIGKFGFLQKLTSTRFEIKALTGRYRNTTGNPAGINFKCDPRRKTLTCKFGTDSALIGFPNRKLAYMIFCPRFFYQPAALECEAPSTANPYIQDQAGTLLHELIHVRWLVNRDIGDGYSASGEGGECYGWPCVTSYAQNRNLPGFDPRNLPENVASNYEYYAFAVRAAYTDCSWTTYAGSMFGIGTLIN